ncbi:peroxiredoxin-like family protein [Coraliomargarita sp. SDUM461004]|uniref:thioredoxin-dependent peroxiredoxin n=1 Tax=Thalassobacterium sedimentorum TaxID=3041258 RepID=A0ABU1AKS1_9BACT|nr:peroxiredoxin-like family protein [Coraliomargarita sp. SDUM461004]MDQ8195344.1 peroxiredoxin-like family protein [Coraliomargarita sp. SDUM461004]
MPNLKDQLAAQVAKTRQIKPEFMLEVDKLIVAARETGVGAQAIAIGQPAPEFNLQDAHNHPVALNSLVRSGAVVLVFYRGSWCPYCNLQIHALQSRIQEIQDLGAQLVAISPQKPDNSLSQIERDKLEFTVLSDQDCDVAMQYGVAWDVPSLFLDHMRKDRGLDLVEINQGNGSRLPIPAIFIVDRSGRVIWRSIDVDYRSRAEPEDVINALQNSR